MDAFPVAAIDRSPRSHPGRCLQHRAITAGFNILLTEYLFTRIFYPPTGDPGSRSP